MSGKEKLKWPYQKGEHLDPEETTDGLTMPFLHLHITFALGARVRNYPTGFALTVEPIGVETFSSLRRNRLGLRCWDLLKSRNAWSYSGMCLCLEG